MKFGRRVKIRCDCCDRALSDYESTLKHAETGEFLNTCVKCLDGLDIPSVGRPDLTKKEPDEAPFVFQEEEPEED